MKKSLKIGLLFTILLTFSCTVDEDAGASSQISTSDSVINEVEDVNNPFELSEGVIAQRDVLLDMLVEEDNVNWKIGVDMEEWDSISVDDSGNVTSLNAGNFIKLDESLGELIYLNSLFVSEQSIPEENDIVLPELETLTVTNGSSDYIPLWVYNTTSLKYLLYSDSSIEVIADNISSLINLEYLIIEEGTPLLKVSPKLGDLTSLRIVNFSTVGTGLESVPYEVCDLIVKSGTNVLLPKGVSCDEE